MTAPVSTQLRSFRNVVMHIGMNQPWDSMQVPVLLTRGRYDAQLFPSVITHLQTNCTLSIFATGNNMATGGRSQYLSIVSALLLADRINRIVPGKCARVTKWNIVNLVTSVHLGYDLDIDKLQRDFQFSGLYERPSFQVNKVKQTP